MNQNQYRESKKMKKQKNMFQTKEQYKTLETDNKMKVSDIPNKDFKIMS